MKKILLGVIIGWLIVVGVWGAGWHKIVKVEMDDFFYNEPTLIRCEGWSNKWHELVGSGTELHCRKENL